jgi:hypothetical protein
MKLEMDLVRDILLWCEDKLPDNDQSYDTTDLVFSGFTSSQIMYHFKLLRDCGYIESEGDASINSSNRYAFFPECLTMSGYDFLGQIKNDTLFNGMKEEAAKIGVQVVKAALPILAQLFAKHAGLI